MKRKRPFRKDILPLVQEPGADDGIDPRLIVHRHRERQPDRKALQLCGVVARTIRHALHWELHDDRLADLEVSAVQPAPSTARLLVTVALLPTATLSVTEALGLLQQHTGRLRTLIAESVQRRRVPELIFQVASAAGNAAHD